MPRLPMKTSTKILAWVSLCAIAAAAWLLWGRSGVEPLRQTAVAPDTANTPAPSAGPSATAPREPPPATVVGPEAIEKSEDLKRLMDDRKARYGIDKGVDFIAAPNESIEVGGIVVPMREILEKIRLKRGDIIENEIGGRRTRAEIEADLQALEARMGEVERLAASGDPAARQRAGAELAELTARRGRLQRELDSLTAKIDPDAPVDLYGIYVVRPNDNIWNIHFNFLKELFRNKGIALSPLADEPTPSGRSSGVGKLLKFSETMVAIYNLREHRLDPHLDLITPNSKVVVFNFTKVFSMLDQIDYKNIGHIQFDGETIWIPAAQ